MDKNRLGWLEFSNLVHGSGEVVSSNAVKCIEFNLGLDTAGNVVKRTLGNSGDVHMICTGGTGAGKSTFVSQLILDLTKKYSEDELHLYLLDPKGVEFNMYRDKAGSFTFPHIQKCVSTDNVFDIMTAFELFRIEAESRYETFKSLGCKNYVQYREQLQEGDDYFPRVVIIMDEFQKMFKHSTVAEQFSRAVLQFLKLGRTVGMHLVFASQSPTGLSEDYLNSFTLRVALRCCEEVSLEMLGTTKASEIEQVVGIAYVQSLRPEATVKIEVPMVTDRDIKEQALGTRK